MARFIHKTTHLEVDAIQLNGPLSFSDKLQLPYPGFAQWFTQWKDYEFAVITTPGITPILRIIPKVIIDKEFQIELRGQFMLMCVFNEQGGIQGFETFDIERFEWEFIPKEKFKADKKSFHTVITLLQKELLRLNSMSADAHTYKMEELYTDIDKAIDEAWEAIKILRNV